MEGRLCSASDDILHNVMGLIQIFAACKNSSRDEITSTTCNLDCMESAFESLKLKPQTLPRNLESEPESTVTQSALSLQPFA